MPISRPIEYAQISDLLRHVGKYNRAAPQGLMVSTASALDELAAKHAKATEALRKIASTDIESYTLEVSVNGQPAKDYATRVVNEADVAKLIAIAREGLET